MGNYTAVSIPPCELRLVKELFTGICKTYMYVNIYEIGKPYILDLAGLKNPPFLKTLLEHLPHRTSSRRI